MAFINPNKDNRSEFLAQITAQKQAEVSQKQQDHASRILQRNIRSFVSNRRLRKTIIDEYDAILSPKTLTCTLPTASITFQPCRRMIFIYHRKFDEERLITLCKYMTMSLSINDAKKSQVMIALGKYTVQHWPGYIKRLTSLASDLLIDATPANLLVLIDYFLTISDTDQWKLLKSDSLKKLKPSLDIMSKNFLDTLVRNKFYEKLNLALLPLFDKTLLIPTNYLYSAILLSMRPISNGREIDENFVYFLQNIMTLPALVEHLQSSILVQQFVKCAILERTLLCLQSSAYGQRNLHALTRTQSLCLMANIVQLADIAEDQVLLELLMDFTYVTSILLEKCSMSIGLKTNQSNWHPILGWTDENLKTKMQNTLPYVSQQLQKLWSRRMLKRLFEKMFSIAEQFEKQQMQNETTKSDKKPDGVRLMLKKLIEKPPAFFANSIRQNRKKYGRLGSEETTLIALVCTLYLSALRILTQLKSDILCGICNDQALLPKLWQFITSLGQNNGLNPFLEVLIDNSNATSPEFAILHLFADAGATLISILDEHEVYEEQRPFKLSQLNEMATFTNQFCIRVVWQGIVDLQSLSNHHLFNSILHFTNTLYNKDSRRRFTESDRFWLISDPNPKTFNSEYKNGNPRAVALVQRLPHLLPQKTRVTLFRETVENDRVASGFQPRRTNLLGAAFDHFEEHFNQSVSAPLVTVHRSTMIEDGYRALSDLNMQSLKGTVRIKFVNEQGLEEAGIDQHGVFKEFLEETIKRIFDPSLSLFVSTSEGKLYPSPNSYIQENHLHLFDFVGKMLGKALYEGIVVEVHFTHFVLASLLGRRFNAFDELPSLDADLYKQLTYIKHLDSDVADLELTFSYDEDRMGQIVTHDLVPGGSTIQVTNDNKIAYIHRLAHFRICEQTREQMHAFVQGFRQVISPSWLSLFSPVEFQMLISGTSEDIDLQDLRAHTNYYGGYHNQHKVVGWLWDVLKNDFDANERRMFLKFVTSCSKAPLLGFAHLEPRFSIRCVEVSDDNDSGDTIGSIVRGFLSMKKSGESIDRLPTSSTCFNLLKLPAYTRKSLLRDKLRYAIHSGTGFELS